MDTNTNLFVIEDENYKLVVKAKNWKDAKQKAISWSKNKMSLDINRLEVSICDNNEVIE